MTKNHSSFPDIMVAPNGAKKRSTPDYHVPITTDEVALTAAECYAAGACAIHAHTRDDNGEHILDAHRSRQLITAIQTAAPAMRIQITTEAVGIYSTEAQMQFVEDLGHEFYSVALREIIRRDDNSSLSRAADFYHRCHQAGIELQHILYSASEVTRLAELRAANILPCSNVNLLFVLGRYQKDQQSSPHDLLAFKQALNETQLDKQGNTARISICAFGQQETDCLIAANKLGWHARIGFENNTLNADGKHARSNAERVSALINALTLQNNH